MTSSLSPYASLRAEAVPAQLLPVDDVIDADRVGTDAELNLAPARRSEDADEAESPHTRAGLFAGLLLCAGSSSLMIWLATLLL
jgi:hypothetical protein